MHETLEQLLKTVADRQNAERWGIRTAKDYLSGLSQCFGDCACALTHSKLATPEQWQKALEESAGRLCYSDEQTGVLNKSMFSLPPTPKAALDFACVLTSTRRDRDGDVLESSGAEIDEKMPLLWQHIPMSPIGTLKSVLSKNDHNVQVHFAIADTELGRDAATLVEFGALRMSHGFKPKVAEPMADGKGWNVKSFSVVEGSLVSIPANPDGVVTAYSREKLTHPVVKGWAKSLADARPKSVTVPAQIEQIAKPAEQKGTLQTGDTYDLTGNCGCKCGACMGCKGKAAQPAATKRGDFAVEFEALYDDHQRQWLKEAIKTLVGSTVKSIDVDQHGKVFIHAGQPEVEKTAAPEPVVKQPEPLTFGQAAAMVLAKSDAAQLHEVECLLSSLQLVQRQLSDREIERQFRELLEVQ